MPLIIGLKEQRCHQRGLS